MFNRELKEEIADLERENKWLLARINIITKPYEAKITELESMLTPKQRLAIKSTDELLKIAKEYRIDITELTKSELIERILLEEAILKRG